MEYNFYVLTDDDYQIEFNKTETEFDTINMLFGDMDPIVIHWEFAEPGDPSNYKDYIGYERETTQEELSELRKIFELEISKLPKDGGAKINENTGSL